MTTTDKAGCGCVINEGIVYDVCEKHISTPYDDLRGANPNPAATLKAELAAANAKIASLSSILATSSQDTAALVADQAQLRATVQRQAERVRKLEQLLHDARMFVDGPCHGMETIRDSLLTDIDAALSPAPDARPAATAHPWCLACGERHDPLLMLKDECLAALPVVTGDQIEAAIERGRRERDIAEGRKPTPPSPESMHGAADGFGGEDFPSDSPPSSAGESLPDDPAPLWTKRQMQDEIDALNRALRSSAESERRLYADLTAAIARAEAAEKSADEAEFVVAERNRQLDNAHFSLVNSNRRADDAASTLAARDVECAAMREALKKAMSFPVPYDHGVRGAAFWHTLPHERPCIGCELEDALATDAGASILRERDELREQIERYKKSIAITDKNFRALQDERDMWKTEACANRDHIGELKSERDHAVAERDALRASLDDVMAAIEIEGGLAVAVDWKKLNVALAATSARKGDS